MRNGSNAWMLRPSARSGGADQIAARHRRDEFGIQRAHDAVKLGVALQRKVHPCAGGVVAIDLLQQMRAGAASILRPTMCRPSGISASSISSSFSQSVSGAPSVERFRLLGDQRFQIGAVVVVIFDLRQRCRLSFSSCRPLYRPACATGGVRWVMVTAPERRLASDASDGLFAAYR